MVKEINFFLPVDELGQAESERHYLAVHVPQSRYMYRGLPSVQRYTPHRVVAKRDLNKTFHERPDRWRFVIMHHSGEQNYLRPEVIERIWIDHGNCLEHITNYQLREEVLHDARSGQTALTKYVLVVPTTAQITVDDAWKQSLTAAFGTAFGARLLVFNAVTGSLRTKDRGRVITGELDAETDASALLELYFDNEDWGQEFLADSRVEALLALELAGGTAAYQVREEPGCDHR